MLLSGIFFAAKVQRMFNVRRETSRDGAQATYYVEGQIFFASVDRFTRSFSSDEAARSIRIDVSAAHFWDISAVGALDKIVDRLRREGRAVAISGYTRACADIVDRFALHDKTGVELGAVPH